MSVSIASATDAEPVAQRRRAAIVHVGRTATDADEARYLDQAEADVRCLVVRVERAGVAAPAAGLGRLEQLLAARDRGGIGDDSARRRHAIEPLAERDLLVL